MPLDVTKLIEGIRRFTDPGFEGFEEFPETEDRAADFWARAALDYFQGQTVPPPGGAAYSSPASHAMKPIFKGFSAPFAAPVILPTAFATAVAVIAAMSLPAAVPPPAPLVIPPMPPVNSALLGAITLAAAVDAWARTGLFAPSPDPPKPPWS